MHTSYCAPSRWQSQFIKIERLSRISFMTFMDTHLNSWTRSVSNELLQECEKMALRFIYALRRIHAELFMCILSWFHAYFSTFSDSLYTQMQQTVLYHWKSWGQ